MKKNLYPPDEKYSILQNAKREAIVYDPFPHIIINNCLPSDLYRELESSYPSDQFIQDNMRNRQGENVRVKIRFDQIYYQQTSWPNDYHWRNFVNFHLSDIFYKQILDLFKPEFKSTLYGIENRLKTPLESARILPHIPDQEKSFEEEIKTIFLEGDIGINTPLTKKSSVRKSHVDGIEKLFGGLFYFKRDIDNAGGGNLEIARWKYGQKEIFDLGFQIKEDYIEKVKVMKCEANKAIIWVNSPKAIHGVTPRDPSANSRRLIYLSGRVGKKCFPNGIFPNAKQKLTFFQKFYYKFKKLFLNFKS